MTFEEDYFGVPAGTFRDEITVLARKFAADVYKAPEQRELALQYLDRQAWYSAQ